MSRDELRPRFLFGMRLNWPEVSKAVESDEKGVNPPKGSLLRSTIHGAIVTAAGSRIGRVGLGALVGSSPSSIELVSGGLEAWGLWRGSEDRSIVWGSTRPRIGL